MREIIRSLCAPRLVLVPWCGALRWSSVDHEAHEGHEHFG